MAAKKKADSKDTKKPTKLKPTGSAGGGAKAKKKKWSKGKTKEKLNHAVLFDQQTYDKMIKEVPHMKLITTAVMCDRLKINGSLARRALNHLAEKGLIKLRVHHGSQSIYTRATTA